MKRGPGRVVRIAAAWLMCLASVLMLGDPVAGLDMGCPDVARPGVDTLARFVEAEAGEQPLVCKVAVASVVLNRISLPQFPPTISGVIFQPGAFRTPHIGGLRRRPGAQSVRAALMAISGIDPSQGATKFWDPRRALSRIRWQRHVVTILGDYFFGV